MKLAREGFTLLDQRHPSTVADFDAAAVQFIDRCARSPLRRSELRSAWDSRFEFHGALAVEEWPVPQAFPAS